MTCRTTTLFVASLLLLAGCSSEPKAKSMLVGKWAPVEAKQPLVIAFTKDNRITLDGDTSALAPMRVLGIMSDFGMRVSPETRGLHITYKFTGENQIEIEADLTFLAEKLSAGSTRAPTTEEMKQLRPKETFTITSAADELTLTNDEGKSLKFKRAP